ncbi:MAG TPA: hypothetical protein VK625_13815, partial [Flavitalea sp.]|nr:hypothetical protein [Flavitalea sp.]
MTIHAFIFSKRLVHRTYRHAVFWIAYCTFFFIQSFVPSDYSGFFSSRTYLIALKSILHFVPACIISVYISIYYILPVLIEKKKIAQSVLAISLLFAFDTYVNYFFSAHFHQIAAPNIEPKVSFNILLGLAYLNAIWAFIITG